MPEAHQLDPAHIETLARILHDLAWIEPPGSDRFDRKPERFKQPYRVSAAQALIHIDTLAAKIAAIAEARA